MDLSTLSDEQLLLLRQQAPAAPKPAAVNPLSQMTDAELLAARKPPSLAGTDVAIPQTATENLFGVNGPRHQYWPERLVRGVVSSAVSGATFPGDVLTGNAQPPGTHYLRPGQTTLSDEDLVRGQNRSMERMLDLTAIASPVNPAVRAGDRLIPGTAKNFSAPKPVVPSAETLESTGAAQIEKTRNMGVDLKADAVKSLGQSIEQHLESKGFSDEFAGETFGILKRLRNPPEGSIVTFGNMQTVREALNKAAGSPDSRERAAAVQAIRQLDTWLSKDAPGAVVAGPTSTPAAAAEAADLYKTGRGNYAAAQRSAEITGRAELAELRAAAANSGRNIDNATRQRFVNIVADESQARGFNPAEVAGAERVVRGTPGMNASRYIAHLLGGGGGLGQALTGTIGAGIGATAGTFLGLPLHGAVAGAGVPALIGAISKQLSNKLTQSEVRKLDELIRSRSPMHENNLSTLPMEASGVTKR